MTTTSAARPVRAARGTELSCLGWQQEAALRMLQNNLDPEVAEHPDELVVYGGTGKAARNWACFDAIVATLRTLRADETMLVQSGKPVGVFTTHEWAPRVLLANSNLVGDWATWEEFRRLEALGLTMFGQMTAGSWIYIGSQGILQGTYETFAAVAAKRFGGDLAGTITLTGGLGGMGGAQPLAVTMAGGVAICVESTRRGSPGGSSAATSTSRPPTSTTRCGRRWRPATARRPLSIGLLGNAADVVPRLLAMGAPIDVVTDQTSAHDPLAYLPLGVAFEDWRDYARAKPEEFTIRARESMARHVEAMVGFQDAGAEVFDYGNSIRAEARLGGYDAGVRLPGFRARPTSGRCSARARARSGGRRYPGIRPTSPPPTAPCSICSRENESLARWMRMAAEKVHFEGLPARICWLGYGERNRAGVRFNELVAAGQVKAPIVIGRDHLDCGSVASPYRETEAMADGSDAIADWPLLNAMVNVASGASWVSIHHGGGVGIGRSIHAGQVCVADGTELAGREAGAGCSPTTRAWALSGTSTPGTSGRPRSPGNAASGYRCWSSRDPDRGSIRPGLDRAGGYRPR